MQAQHPEFGHGYETAVHHSFHKTLIFCQESIQNMDSPFFIQCIKAGGINFASSYDQFFDYRTRRTQVLNMGIPQ